MKCPGQDTQFWGHDSIFEVECPRCCGSVEFFKDDNRRRCGFCGHSLLNPRMDFGCAVHCPSADQCMGNPPSKPLALGEKPLEDRDEADMASPLEPGTKSNPPNGGVQ